MITTIKSIGIGTFKRDLYYRQHYNQHLLKQFTVYSTITTLGLCLTGLFSIVTTKKQDCIQ